MSSQDQTAHPAREGDDRILPTQSSPAALTTTLTHSPPTPPTPPTNPSHTPTPRPPSPSPSTASTATAHTTTTTASTLCPPSTDTPYRGFPSKHAYLQALHDWAESKKYIEPLGTEVEGLYGEATIEELARRPGLGIRRKLKGKLGRGGKKGSEEREAEGRRELSERAEAEDGRGAVAA